MMDMARQQGKGAFNGGQAVSINSYAKEGNGWKIRG
jgi:hypothetical protein